MKNLIIFFLLLGSSGNLFSQKELNDYLKTAAENNASLKMAFSEYRAALEMLPQAKALPDPNLMFQYFTTPVYQEMGIQRFSLSASQAFPWFGQLKSKEQAAAEMAKAKYESFIDERNKLFKEVKEIYFKLYVQHKAVQITTENITILGSMRELAKIGFESGKGSFVNVLRSDMEIAEMENKLEYLKDGKIKISLTKQGSTVVKKLDIEQMKIPKPASWDQKWRVVIFDVPNWKSKNRLAFTERLKHIGFRMIQKSVWGYPFPCHDEIMILRKFYDIEKYVTYLETAMVEDEYLWRQRFSHFHLG